MQPSDKALVPFVSVDHMMEIVNAIGPAKMMTESYFSYRCR